MTGQIKHCPILAEPLAVLCGLPTWNVEEDSPARAEIRGGNGQFSKRVLQMLKYVPECYYVELAFVPESQSQFAHANIEAERTADTIHHAAVVLNGPHVPAYVVGRYHEVARPASDFQHLVPSSIAARKSVAPG